MSVPNTPINKLQSELDLVRRYSLRASKEIHGLMKADVEAALALAASLEKKVIEADSRARDLERQLRNAEQRASAAEGRLEQIRNSSTWRAGRVVVAVPAKIRRFIHDKKGG